MSTLQGKKLLITGGVGFIGINAAEHFLRQGCEVMVLDNFSRKGSEANLEWLLSRHELKCVNADITEQIKLNAVISDFSPNIVIHLAAQVAVTTSIMDPFEDFNINAKGTLNILESCRLLPQKPFVIFSSTNKVYGDLDDVEVVEKNIRWEFEEDRIGIDESQILDFHSPYGCSKGVADQYCLDYSRIYGLQTAVFRQSCIYGTRQLGVEDQGWVAWFIIAALLGRQITIFGDGKQVRDLLDVRDLVSAFETAIIQKDKISGNAFNIGGGKSNSMSVREVINFINLNINEELNLKYDNSRQGDQKVYISDTSKFTAMTGWVPKINVEMGIHDLMVWARKNKKLFEEYL